MAVGPMVRKLAVLALAGFAWSAAAGETPHGVWIKAKCAVCHGEDGAGKTAEGKRRNVPDLRAKQTQKRSDAELYDLIVAQHGKMPGFHFKKEQVSLLVLYIRSVAAK